MKLSDASIEVRKAAALQGIKSGTFDPIFDSTGGPSRKIGTVSDGRKSAMITVGDWTYAEAQTWESINK